MKLLALLLLAAPLWAGIFDVTLSPKSVQAFEAFIQQREAVIERQRLSGTSFLWCDDSPERAARLKSGGLAIEQSNSGPGAHVPGALVHDWTGAVFIGGTTLAKTLAFVQHYDRHKIHYAPEVVDSRLISRDGNRMRAYLRLRKQKVITVVLNTEYDVLYTIAGPDKAYSRSYSTKIAEVSDPGTPNERELAPGTGHGFLWRLYSYWRFLERDGGVYVECEAISLTRDIPAGLGPIIRPVIRDLPRESLERTLLGTRAALADK